MTDSGLIWENLSRKVERVVPRLRIIELARRLDLNPTSAIRTLVRGERILPVFKGYYYVMRPDEILHHETAPLIVFAHAAKAKGIGSWYYGLYTALRLNGMSHEYRTDEHVVSTALYRPGGVKMAGRRFVVLKWRSDLTGYGHIDKGPYRYSDPEKTVLDFAYWDHYRRSKGHAATNIWLDHVDSIDRARLEAYLPHYPASVRTTVEASL